MENHPHITGTMTAKKQFSAFFRVVNNLFARKYNKRHKRRGQVVMDRFKSPRVQDDAYMIRAMTYGDLNGVRCGRDKRPDDAKWSSYACYAYGKDDPLITPALSYITLGDTPKERQRAYRGMVKELMRQDRINISNTCFIGDPDWVKHQYNILRDEMKALFARRHSDKTQLPITDPP
jgi:putative transposase